MRSPLPPLYALHAFASAARLGSFTAAGAELHLTQGAVSRQIQLLEQHYGCALFVRQARGLALSAEGTLLLPAVASAFDTLLQAGATLAKGQNVLTLQLPPTFAARWFLPRLPLLAEALPGVEVRIATHWARTPDFSASDVDAIVAHGAGGWPGLMEVPLMEEQLAPMCSPALLAQLATPADLAHVTLLHPDPQRREWTTWLAAAGVTGIDSRRSQVFDTLDMALSAATRSQGVAIADPALLSESLDDGVLVMPFDRRVPSGLRYFLTMPARQAPQRKLALLQAWLTDQLARSAHGDSGKSTAGAPRKVPSRQRRVSSRG